MWKLVIDELSFIPLQFLHNKASQKILQNQNVQHPLVFTKHLYILWAGYQCHKLDPFSSSTHIHAIEALCCYGWKTLLKQDLCFSNDLLLFFCIYHLMGAFCELLCNSAIKPVLCIAYCPPTLPTLLQSHMFSMKIYWVTLKVTIQSLSHTTHIIKFEFSPMQSRNNTDDSQKTSLLYTATQELIGYLQGGSKYCHPPTDTRSRIKERRLYTHTHTLQPPTLRQNNTF